MKAFWQIFSAVVMGSFVRASDLRIEIEPTLAGKPLAFDSLQLTNDAGQTFSVNRLDFHLSELALKDASGSWRMLKDWVAYLSLREGRRGFTLHGVPDGDYQALRFTVGLTPEMNASDAAKRPADHPLSPSVSSLWWGWSGGYVFMALEGGWRRPDHSLSGYSFHLATNAQRMPVMLPLKMDLRSPSRLRVGLDVATILKGVTLADDQNSTHSREGDHLATQLHQNVSAAFSVMRVEPGGIPSDPVKKAALSPNGTLVNFRYPSYLPAPSLPGDNPLTQEGIALGYKLFHDTRLSSNQEQSCASCHQSDHGFAEGIPISRGTEGQRGRRNAMPLVNLAWKSSFFWDGRAQTLRQQVLMPIRDHNEMNLSLKQAEERTGLSRDEMAKALEQYLLTLVSTGSKFDRVMAGKDRFTPSEQRGLTLFNTEYDPAYNIRGADCFHCHGGPLFRSKDFANNGLTLTPRDSGLELFTQRIADRGKFAVPSLRNVALTAPYMHDGRFRTLEEVLDHYDHGVVRSETLDPNLAKHPTQGLDLTSGEKGDIIAFLKTLTDEHLDKLAVPSYALVKQR
jgi:cytochrome c peroxidase